MPKKSKKVEEKKFQDEEKHKICEPPVLANFGAPAATFWGRTFLSDCCFGIAATNTHVFVSDASRHCVHVFDLEAARYVEAWGSQGTSQQVDQPPQFDSPHGLAVDPLSGRLYVADRQNSRIVVVRLADGRVETVWQGDACRNVAYLLIEAGWSDPVGVTWLPNKGAIVISDGFNQRIVMLQVSDGQCVSTMCDGEFNIPQALASDAHHLYIADRGNNRIVVCRQDDGSVMRIMGGQQGNQLGQVHNLQNVDVDTETGLVWLADYYNERVQAWRLEDGAAVPALCLASRGISPWAVLWHPTQKWLFVTNRSLMGMMVYRLDIEPNMA